MNEYVLSSQWQFQCLDSQGHVIIRAGRDPNELLSQSAHMLSGGSELVTNLGSYEHGVHPLFVSSVVGAKPATVFNKCLSWFRG